MTKLDLLEKAVELSSLEAREAHARIAELEETYGLISQWTAEHGASLKPRGADTYGEGMRDAKDQVWRILSRRRGEVVKS